MKLIIQIPCYNEAAVLQATLQCLPRSIEGSDTVEWLIIDDGISDGSPGTTREYGADHSVSRTGNNGLVTAIMTGIEKALRLGADVIVNLDAENQYYAQYIPDLTSPILDGKAKNVICERPVNDIEVFSPHKKLLQRIGSCVVRNVSGFITELISDKYMLLTDIRSKLLEQELGKTATKINCHGI